MVFSFKNPFMSSTTNGTETRPGPQRTKTFPRHPLHDVPDPMSTPRRAITLQASPSADGRLDESPASEKQQPAPDAFETSEDQDEPIEPPRASVDMEDLPIELINMTDNFIDSLIARVHPVPPSIDVLSRRFQDFYETAAQHIQMQMGSGGMRSAGSSPRPATMSRQSAASLLRAKAATFGGGKDKQRSGSAQEPEQQMLTAEELSKRKSERRAMEQKRALFEEAVERRLCEGIFDKIYRHRSTHDEAQDDKLRSKTAALALVGIGPTDLGVDLGEASDNADAGAKRQEEIAKYLEQARKELYLMHEKRYPLGKLNSLKAAYKSIIDTLSHFHPSSSADELMPMLIYTLITMPPEELHVISDSNYIQRFRWEEKLEGEAAYCLTSLQAAINFLETVDLASLRADESPSGPGKLESGPVTPTADTYPPAYTPAGATQSVATVTANDAQGLKPSLSSSSLIAVAQRRRLGDLMQTPAQALDRASDSFFNTADQSLKNIGNSLGDSYKLLVGKLRDRANEGQVLVVPRTLDDARKLIGTPPPEDDAPIDGNPQGIEDNSRRTRRDDRVLSLVGGKRAARERSADSMKSGRSAGSLKKTGPSSDENKDASAPSLTNPVDQLRNLGNSLNPMNRFSGINMMRGFGRTVSTPTPTPTPPANAAKEAGKVIAGGDLATAFPDVAAALPPKDLPQIQGPVKRFMDLQSPADLRLGEVLELLRDYRRLAGALKERGAFREP